ncbi:MAG: hypothetical protein F6K11_28430 [Leptolyngbya sp. SIO3F4]|nr:hypothetical protein [Leptolyngbya sp. SIO3F4]
MASIDVGIKVQIKGGAIISDSRLLEIQATDKVDVVIPAGTADPLSIEIQPSDDPKQVHLLFIQSSLYSGQEDTEKITYSIDGDAKEIELDQPQLYLGSGAISVLGDTPPKIIKFKNTYPSSIPADPATETPEQDLSEQNQAVVSILVGRDAIASS